MRALLPKRWASSRVIFISLFSDAATFQPEKSTALNTTAATRSTRHETTSNDENKKMNARSYPSEVSPPSGWKHNSKFYCGSGSVLMVLTAPAGPIDAALRFVNHALETNQLHRLGDCIEVTEGGFDHRVILRRETSRFLSNKFGLSTAMVDHFIDHETNNE